jgi:hypothetical protein
MAVRQLRIAVSLLVCTVLLFTTQVSSRNQNHELDKKDGPAPLLFRLVILKPSICERDHLDLEIELRTVSAGRVLIDPTDVLYQITFDRKGGGKGTTNDNLRSPKIEQFVSLQPGESYRKKIAYPFSDSFLSTEGVYRMSLSYGQFAPPSASFADLYRGVVDSNVVLFEVRDCSNGND